MIGTVFQVALGGAIGSAARHLTNVAVMRAIGAGFPWATVIVNVLGSFAMGVIVVALAHKGGARLSPFLMTGLLGGFTTFSAFSLDAVTLWDRGASGLAVAYVLGSVLVSIAALLAGMAVMRGGIA